MRIAIGADHAGFLLKEHLKATLRRLGHTVDDHGADSEEPIDYPPICLAVAREVAEGRAGRGIVLGGSGQGEQIAANKVTGIRAALCNDLHLARLFLNAAAVGETDLSAPALLSMLLALEGERGRERPFTGAPRTLDLDLILLGNHVVDEPGVIVPHPRFRQRRFVLAPLAEIAPELVDPVSGRTIEQLLRALPGQ